MKKLISLAILAVAFLILAACGGKAAASGKAVFVISDAAGDMGAVSSIRLTVDGVQVHSSGGGWVSIVNAKSSAFDLIKLRDEGTAQLLAQADLKAGAYDMISLNVSKVIVVDASGEHEAKLPSNKLEIKGDLDVKANTSATANLDFLADQSLHVTGNGLYILSPVVKLETRSNASALVESNNNVKIIGGNIKTNVQAGMDIEGNTDVGLRVSPDAVLSIAASGKIVQTKGHALVAGTIKSVDTANGTVTLNTKSGTELVLHVAGDSSLKVNGSAVALASLSGQVGAEVTTQYDAETKAVAKLAAGADVSAKADVGANIDISGTIKSVDMKAGTVTVTTGSGADVTLKVGSGANINVGGLLDLGAKIGSNVNAVYNGTTGTTGEIKAETEARVTVSGTIKAVNAAEGTVTIASQSGTETTLKIASNAKILVNGSLKTLAELKGMIGTDATVTYSQQTMLAREINASGQVSGSASASVSGVIKAVNPAQGTVTITTGSGKEVVLNVTSASSIVADGQVSALVSLATKIGAQVNASYNSQTNAVSSLDVKGQASGSASATVSGTLKSVDVLKGTITVATQSGADMALKVTGDTKVTLNGATTDIATLAANVGIGTQIVANYNSQTSAVSSLDVKGQASGSTSATVSGTLKAVDAVQNTVTIATQSGANVVLKVTGDTKATLNGASTAIASLATNIGAQVSADYNAQTNAVTSLSAQASGSASASVSGVIKAVNPAQGTVTITTASGQDVVLNVTSASKIVADGSVSTLVDMATKIGAQASADYNIQSKMATSLSAQASGGTGTSGQTGATPTPTASIGGSASASLSGTLKAVDAVQGTVTVTSQSGADVVLKATGDTTATLNGSTVTLVTLAANIGAQVNVSYNTQTNAATSISAQGQASASATVSGTLKTIDVVQGTVTIVTQSGVEVVLKYTNDTKATFNGAAASITYLAANQGSQVAAKYNGQTNVATSLEAQGQVKSTITASGTLKAYNPLNNTITITTQIGGEVVLTMTSQTKVLINGAASALISLPARVGSQVTAEYQATTNTVITLDIKA